MGAERAAGSLAERLAPEVAAALGAIARVARALVGSGTLAELAEGALSEMREALGFSVAALYLPVAGPPPALERYVRCAGDGAGVEVRERLVLDEEALRFAGGGSPLVFHTPASWLGDNPFVPPAQSWLVLPLLAQRRTIGVVVAAGAAPARLDPAGATVLTLLGDLLSAGIANARLRQDAQQAQVERDRMRLAADVHDTLAQDLALAKREVSLLASGPPEMAAASLERLTEAVASAHRVVRARLEDLAVSVPLGGVGPAVEELCARFRSRGLDVACSATGPASDVAAETAAVVLRVLTESLTNVQKHAGAPRARVELCAGEDRLRLVVEDDGPGLPPGEHGDAGNGHFGLAIMRRRAEAVGGTLEVGAAASGGVRVVLDVPASGRPGDYAWK